jgi:hypothetical protein
VSQKSKVIQYGCLKLCAPCLNACTLSKNVTAGRRVAIDTDLKALCFNQFRLTNNALKLFLCCSPLVLCVWVRLFGEHDVSSVRDAVRVQYAYSCLVFTFILPTLNSVLEQVTDSLNSVVVSEDKSVFW